MCEIEWMVDRAKLYDLRRQRPEATIRMLSQELKRSEGWVSKWLKRFADHEGEAATLFCSQSRARKTSNKKIDPAVVEAILDIRDRPPQGLNRIPGPKTILYYLPGHEAIKDQNYDLPRSTSTIWGILDENNRIYRRQPRSSQPEPLAAPMEAWQMDFKTVSSVPPEADGKKQHVVESLNIVDTGTSIAIDAVPRPDYHAQTTFITLVDIFTREGMPQTLTFDRDPRFIGAWSANDFPSALMRFLLCVGVMPIVCPPHRPQKNAYVERFNGSYKRECLTIHRPATLADTVKYTQRYLSHYNHDRPHQGQACDNQPPRTVFPDVKPPQQLPAVVDPDAWLSFARQRWYKRRVSSSGSIQMGGFRYYVSQTLAKQQVAVKVQPKPQTLAILTEKSCFKTVPIKGLYQGQMALADYVDAMLQEVLSESRSAAVKRRQKRRLTH